MKEHKGELMVNVAPIFIAALIAIILLFQVLMPVTNTALNNNNTWNATGYSTALIVAQQTPILFFLALFIGVALVVIKLVGGF